MSSNELQPREYDAYVSTFIITGSGTPMIGLDIAPPDWVNFLHYGNDCHCNNQLHQPP